MLKIKKRLVLLVSWLQRFKDSQFQSFKDPETSNILLEEIDPMLPNAHFKVFKNARRFVGFSGTCPLHLFKNCSTFRFITITFSKMMLAVFWTFLNSLVSPKMNNIGSVSHGHVRESWNHENEVLSVFPIMKSKSYYRAAFKTYKFYNMWVANAFERMGGWRLLQYVMANAFKRMGGQCF